MKVGPTHKTSPCVGAMSGDAWSVCGVGDEAQAESTIKVQGRRELIGTRYTEGRVKASATRKGPRNQHEPR